MYFVPKPACLSPWHSYTHGRPPYRMTVCKVTKQEGSGSAHLMSCKPQEGCLCLPHSSLASHGHVAMPASFNHWQRKQNEVSQGGEQTCSSRNAKASLKTWGSRLVGGQLVADHRPLVVPLCVLWGLHSPGYKPGHHCHQYPHGKGGQLEHATSHAAW